jgi:hypothetical protein
MNTLTKNRILQKGDEYRDNGAWKPVPKDNFGLQVQFTDYMEVRRPSETPPKYRPTLKLGTPNNDQFGETPVTAKAARTEAPKRAVSPTPISPDSGERPAAKAEKEKTPVPTPSGTGDASYLPTVVSKKAHMHTQESDRKIIDSISIGRSLTDEEMAALDREKDREVVATFDAAAMAKVVASIYEKIDFPKGTDVIWTGRNGTFHGYGLELMRNGDTIMVSPIGKRGVGNGMIQLPVSVASKLASWLLEQATPKK